MDVIEIPRKSYEDIAISASKVRDLIKEENMNKIKEMVPKVTYDFLNAKEGVEIREKIKLSNSPH